MDKRSCEAQTKRGGACRSFALPGGGRCIAHDATRAEAVRAARARGGRAASKLRSLEGKRRRLDSLVALSRFAGGVIQDALAGATTPDVARVVLYGVGVQRQLLESGDLDRRISALEARLDWAQPRSAASGR